MTAPLLLLALAAAPMAGAQPRVKAVASRTELRVGETFSVEVTATGLPGATYTFPRDPGNQSVELGEPPPPPAGTPAPEASPGTHRYQAAVYAVAEAEVPAIAVSYRLPDGTEGVAKTEAIPLRIVSVLPKDPKEQKLADIRGPVPLGVAPAFWIAAAALALLLAALAFWLLRRRRAPVSAPAAPAAPPHLEALGALDRLASSGLLEGGDYRAYYIALAEIAKRYLEARLGAPVLEMTSVETYSFLRDHPEGSPFALPVRDLSGAADRVKFARGEGLADEARRHLADVRQLVLGLEQKLAPPPAGKAA